MVPVIDFRGKNVEKQMYDAYTTVGLSRAPSPSPIAQALGAGAGSLGGYLAMKGFKSLMGGQPPS